MLYVGKAKELRKRLGSYLRNSMALPPKTALMLSKAKSVSVMAVSTEKEALILEASLIKEYRPRFNVLLRDDKAYPFLKLDVKNDFPRLSMVRKRTPGPALYFGPYPSARAVREAQRLVAAVFGLRTCSNSQMKNRSRPCLQYQIGRCSGPCIGAISKDEYRDRVKQVRMFLEGKTDSLVKALERKMSDAADALNFELAAILRDRINALKKITEKQAVVGEVSACWDVIGCARCAEEAVITVIRVRQGVVKGQEVHRLDGIDDETVPEIMEAFIRDFYQAGPYPRELLLPFYPSNRELLSEWLRDLAGRKILFKSSCRGVRARLLSLARENAELAATDLRKRQEEWSRISMLLSEFLGLRRRPDWIEGFDISNLGGSFPVASIVSFFKGRPDKKNYRHYNMTHIAGPDDYAMIKDAVGRRLDRGLRTGALPDLLLIDGGKGQLGQAVEALREKGVLDQVELVALAKESGDGSEKIYRPGTDEPMLLSFHDPVLLFLQRVRDEAHRFGVKFHRLKREKHLISSKLMGIPGVGPRRTSLLLREFGSVDGIRSVSVEEIMKAASVSRKLAEEILDRLD